METPQNIIPRAEAVSRIADHIRQRDQWIILINPFNAAAEVAQLSHFTGFMAYMDCGLTDVMFTTSGHVVTVACSVLSPNLAVLVTLPKTILAGELSVAIGQDVKHDSPRDIIVPFDPHLNLVSWSRFFVDAMREVDPEVADLIESKEVKM